MSDGPVVGVVGQDAARVAPAVRAAGGVPRAGPATEVEEARFVVAVGEAALLAVGRTRPAVPVLPVAAGPGVRSVPRKTIETALSDLLDGAYQTERHPLVDVSVADRTTATALTDVMLISAEPAQISEFAVSTRGEQVAQFRADGVVVATPAGTPGYAEAAGGPLLAPETDVAAVVPIAPFATDADHWALALETLTLSVERHEPAVQVVVDDRIVGAVDPADPVRLAVRGGIEVAVIDAGSSPFGV